MGKSKTMILTLLAMFVFTHVHAQKVKIKDGRAAVDDVEICEVKDDAVRRLSFSLFTLDGTEQLYFKWIDYGQFGYFEVYDADHLDDIIFESDVTTGYRKWIVKQLFAAEVLSEKGVDEEKLEIFAKKMGMEHSRMREENRP